MSQIKDALQEQSDNLADALGSIIDGDTDRAAATLFGAIASAAVGVPQLAPVATKLVSRLLVNDTDRMLREELAKLKEEERTASEREALVSTMRSVFQEVLTQTLETLSKDITTRPDVAHATAVCRAGNVDNPLLHALHLIPTEREMTPPELFSPPLTGHYANRYKDADEARQAVNTALRISRAGGVPIPDSGDLPFPDKIKPRVFWEKVFLAFDDKSARACGSLLLVERDRVGRMPADQRRSYMLLWNYLVTGEIEPALIPV